MTLNLSKLEPIDYLVIGHITQDMTPEGYQLGGTASFSSLTALSMELRVGVLTSCSPEADLGALDGITVVRHASDQCTTFENLYFPEGRIQYLHHLATPLDASMIPTTWLNTPIVQLAPIAQEVDPKIVRAFPNSLIGVTPQGWLREWDQEGRVRPCDWLESQFVLEQSTAAVLSIEDLGGDESRVDDLVTSIRILVITEGNAGARLYWNGDLRRFRPPSVVEVDPIGAGDIFAAAFFARLHATKDPWEAARFATQLAARSVTRRRLDGVPTPEEVQAALLEVLPKV